MNFEAQPGNLRACCIGGGQIKINPEEKTIHIWDNSAIYGEEPDRQQTTVRMLQMEFPEFKINVG